MLRNTRSIFFGKSVLKMNYLEMMCHVPNEFLFLFTVPKGNKKWPGGWGSYTKISGFVLYHNKSLETGVNGVGKILGF